MFDAHSGFILTPGVRLIDGTYLFDELGCAVSRGEADYRRLLLDTGLATERPRFQPAWLSDLLADRSRAAILESSLVRSGLQSIGHNAVGMVRWWLLVIGLVAIGQIARLQSIVAVGLALTLFLISVLVHEAGHVVAYRLVAAEGAIGVLVSSGARCQLVRPVLAPADDRWVIVAGALAPLIVAVASTPVAYVLPLLFWSWLAVALGHAACLLIPVGDGANLRLTFGR